MKPSPAATAAAPEKRRNRHTTYDEKIGSWQRLLEPLADNAQELAHLEVSRAKLAVMAAEILDLRKQQAAQMAAKQESSRRLKEGLAEAERLATLLRQAVKEHYGIRSEKLTEFGLQPFRGRRRKAKTAAEEPAATAPFSTSSS